jgi:ParB/RepB/Spo0J family partition protein
MEATLLKQKLLEIKIADIKKNGNTRTSMDKKALSELAASIEANGLINPVEVRLENDNYYLVSGHRRLDAVKQLGNKTIPAILVDIDAETAVSHQVIENLQREDLMPLDEAQAYQKLLDNREADNKTLAYITGKSKRYIAERLQLLNLLPKFQKRVNSGEVSIGVAIELSKLPQNIQKQVPEHHLESLEDIKGFMNWLMKSLDNVNFNKEDTDLYKKAGACSSCPKRTGANRDLFPGLKKDDQCLDNQCFITKIRKDVEQKFKKMKDEGNEIIYLRGQYDICPDYLKDFEAEYSENYVPASKAKDIEPVMAIVLSDQPSKTGKVIRLVPVSKLPKETKKDLGVSQPVTTTERPKQTPDERYWRKIDLISFPEREELVRAVLPKVQTTAKDRNDELMRVIANSIVDNAGHDVSNYMDYIGENPENYWKFDFKKKIEKLEGNELTGFLAALALGTRLKTNAEYLYDSEECTTLITYAKFIGVDVEAAEKAIKPPYDEKRQKVLDKFIERNKREPKIKKN